MEKIFIIHGWTYTTEKWNNVVTILKQSGFDAVLLRVPGLTETIDKVWTLEDYVEWLNIKLSGEEKPIVLGHSNGGRIAIAFAAKYPDKIGKLILEDAAGIFHNELPIKIKRLIFGTAAKIGKKITSSETIRKIIYKLAGESDYRNANVLARKTMANLISVDLTSRLENITTPTLIIWGAKDKATPLADGKLMNHKIAGSKMFIIKEAAHSPHFSHPKEVCEKILSILR